MPIHKKTKPISYYGTNRVLHPDGGTIFKCADGLCYENTDGEVCTLIEDPNWDDLRVFPEYRYLKAYEIVQISHTFEFRLVCVRIPNFTCETSKSFKKSYDFIRFFEP
jgi:hypothetical protein